MSSYPEPENYIRDKVKVELDLSNYATKKELDHDTGVVTSDLASRKNSISLKAEADKLDINKLVNVPTSLNNFFKKVDDLDVGKLNTFSVDLNKLSDVVGNDATTFIRRNKYNIHNQNLEKKNWKS